MLATSIVLLLTLTIKVRKNLLTGILIFVFSLVYTSQAQVSDISFDHIFLEDGLSQSIVKCILQDYQGFMYFGTEDGLNIYDAYSFKVLRRAGDSNSLSYNDITSICEDNHKRIWIGTFNSGVNLYVPDEKKFIRFNYSHIDSNSLSNDNINAIIEDEKGNIWVGTDKGINQIVNAAGTESGFFIKRGVNESFKNNWLADIRILSLLADKQGDLWIGTTDGLVKMMKDNEKNHYTLLEFKHSSTNKKSISNNTIRAIFEDSEGNIWIGTDNGLNKIPSGERNKKLPEFQRYFHAASDRFSLSHNEIYAICEDERGLIWIGTNGGGVNIFEKEKKQFVSYVYDPLDNRSLSVNEIRSLYRDRSGIMWIGTYGGGLNKVSRGGQFFHYKHRANDMNSLSHSIIWSFCEDNDGSLWIGTHNGLNKLNRKKNTYKYFVHTPGINSLSNNVVRVVNKIDEDKLLIGTNGGGVDVLNIKTGKFRNWSHDPANPNSLIYNEIRSIYKDKDGIIWIGTYGRGMDRLDPATGLFKHYYNNPDNTNTLSQNYVRVIIEDSEGYLWIGTEGGGLNRFDRRKEQWTRFSSQSENPNPLSSDYIFSILIDTTGLFWIGTYGGGLNLFNPETGEAKVYTISDGLPSNSIYGILKDDYGFLWISTTNGISRFNPFEEKFKNFNVKDGLQNNEFNGGSYYKTNDGEMLFGGINGFSAFHPKDIKDNNYVPPVVLTSFKKFNKEFDFSVPLTLVKEIELSYSDNVFSFEFATLDYSSPEKNQYAYKMEGIDKDWVYVDANKRFASYTTLTPGKYTFYVKGSNSDGVWNEQGVRIFLTIVPPFWQRLWFIAAAVLVVVVIVYLLYLRRLRIIRMKVELQTAHNAQLSIMPHSDPVLDKLEISGTCIPANEVGGDFFDYFWLDDEKKKFGIIMGDVSGKAMKAAITAIMTSGMIISETRSNKSISNILKNVNASLLNKIEKNMFVSVCLCAIDTEKKLLSVSNAGLNKPILLSDGEIKLLQSKGPRLPLGVKRNINYEQTDYNLKAGDIVILTTDGINEAHNNSKELFGEERLINHILSLNKERLSVSEIKNSIIKEVQKFIKKDKPNDDMTVLTIRIA